MGRRTNCIHKLWNKVNYRYTFFLFMLLGTSSMAQEKHSEKEQRLSYLRSNMEILQESDVPEFKLIDKESDHPALYLFGAYHGSVSPQILDLKLLKYFVLEKKIRYYFIEVDFTLAHYLNRYLSSGDTALLKQVVLKYQKRVPQDASIQLFNKWLKIKAFNDSLPAERKIEVIGIDVIISPVLYLNYLDELHKSVAYTNNLLDSLTEYKKTNWDDYELYTNQKSRLGKFLLSIHNDFQHDQEKYRKGLGRNFLAFKMLIDNASYIVGNKYIDRDSLMARNYLAMKSNDMLTNGTGYGFLGFSHVLQANIGETVPFGCYLKKSNVTVRSILGLMKDSKVMWKLNRKENGDYKSYDIARNQAGYKWNYRQEGINVIDRLAGNSNLTLFDLERSVSPFRKQLYFINLSRGAKANDWIITKDHTTTDFIQYIILIKKSKASVPIQAAFPGIEKQ